MECEGGNDNKNWLSPFHVRYSKKCNDWKANEMNKNMGKKPGEIAGEKETQNVDGFYV